MSPPKFNVMNTRYLKNPPPPKQEEEIDEETGEVVVQKEYKGKPITREQALELEYKALVCEGQTLYFRNEFYRAIDSFTKATNINKEDVSILIDRANCYIQVGNPKAALLDINAVLKNKPDDTRAILAKAEAFFSMGEFEFALVFFEKGLAIRKDLAAFKDGITKATHAILDSINGEKPFQPNPNFAVSRPRKPLTAVKTRTPMEKDEDDDRDNFDGLLPEKVEPLNLTTENKSSYLGELSLDYDYLVELREETIQRQDEEYGKKEDEAILKYANEGIVYLEQRAQFWSQQGTTEVSKENSARVETLLLRPQTATNRPPSARRNAPKVTRVPKESGRPKPPRRPQTGGERPPHYEMSKIQLYEAKYGKKT